MDYFQLLDLKKEPFSNSPDPEFFYGARQHVACLQKLELSVRLRRGLNVVVADVGMGKTTLCRQLLRRFAGVKEIDTHLLLDPSCSSSLEFLAAITEMFGEEVNPEEDTERRLKERIKDYLFRQGVENDRAVVLIIDEGQKLPVYGVEVLREFLNYETNSKKLLQIVIFAQNEFKQVLKAHPNFADRVSLYQALSPLSRAETKALVQFRLKEAGEGVIPAVFTPMGYEAVYGAAGGYPRKIIELCHRVLVTLIIKDKKKGGWFFVKSCSRAGVPMASPSGRLRPVFMTALLLCTIGIFALIAVDKYPDLMDALNMENPAPAVAAAAATGAAHVGPAELESSRASDGAATVDAPGVSIAPAPPEPVVKAQIKPPPAAAASNGPDAEINEKTESRVVEPVHKAALPTVELVNLWGGHFPGYSQIIFWFDSEVEFYGPQVEGKTADIRFSHAATKLAPFRLYNSFPGWVSLKDQSPNLVARIGLPNNLDGVEHFILQNPYRMVVNLYHSE